MAESAKTPRQSGHVGYSRRLSTATWTTSLVVLACLAFIAVEIHHIIEQRNYVLSTGKKENANLTSSLLQHAELTFRTADALLIAAVFRLEHAPLDPENQKLLKSWFVQEVQHSPQFSSFAVVDSTGAMLINSTDAPATATFTDREYFVHHRSHSDHELYIDAPIRGRTTEGWLIPVSRRFNRADGTFGGVVIATINPRYFQRFYEGLEIGRNGAILLASLDGKILVRRPFVDANVGRDLSQGGIFQQLKTSPMGSIEL